MKNFISLDQAKQMLADQQCMMRKASSIRGGARGGLQSYSSYYLFKPKGFDAGNNEIIEGEFVGSLRSNNGEKLERLCNASRIVMNRASGTGNGWVYWVKKAIK